MKSPETVSACLYLAAEGWSAQKIGKHFRISRGTIGAWMRENALGHRIDPRRATHEWDGLRSLVLTMYCDGRSTNEIAEVTRLQRSTICYWVKEAGLSRLRSEAQLLSAIWRNGKEGSIHGGYRVLHRNGRTIPEHRIVMEEILGRPLSQDETVHHRNGDRLDNRPENLELWLRQPPGQRVQDRVQDALETLARYSGEFV